MLTAKISFIELSAMKGKLFETGARVRRFLFGFFAAFSYPTRIVGTSRAITDLQATHRWLLTGSVFVSTGHPTFTDIGPEPPS